MASIKIPAIGFLGAGSGISVGTLTGEFTARVAGQTKWAAAGVKGLVKTGVGALAYLGSTKVMNPSASFFAEMFAYGTLGSIFLDVALAAYPGGITGLAEDWAVAFRAFAFGARKASKGITDAERATMPPFPKVGTQTAETSSASLF